MSVVIVGTPVNRKVIGKEDVKAAQRLASSQVIEESVMG
jgi:hypothetical protein